MFRLRPLTIFRHNNIHCCFPCSKSTQSKLDVGINVSKNSVPLKHLFDRFLLTTTFPGKLSSDLSHFDTFPSVVYAGFDPTSPNLHIGNLLIINSLLHLYAAGFDVIVLVGSATCKLGDPSGKSAERPSIEWLTINENSAAINSQLQGLFSNFTDYIYKGDRSDLKPVRFLNNARWYKNLNVITFLDDIGRRFRISHLLEKSAVRQRMSEGGMNINEFLYQLFQAYDFLRIFEEFNCLIQLGGSDQTGNVHSGHDLIQKVHDKEAVGIFAPLLTDDEGEKLGKSVGNGITLNPKTTSAFEFYQYFLRLPDLQMKKYLYLYSFFPLQAVDELYDRHLKRPEDRLAQKRLADHVTTLVHGKSGLESAKRSTDALYSNKIETVTSLSQEEIGTTFKNVPNFEIRFRNDVTLLELALKTNLFKNEENAVDLIAKGALYVNLIRIQDPSCIMVKGTHILPNDLTVLRFGKKQTVLVRWTY